MAEEFISQIKEYDISIPYIPITHGNCVDGSFALYYAISGLKSLGFSVETPIKYYHNTDNFSQHLSSVKDKHLLFLDVTPTPSDYQKLKDISSSISIIDHHPQRNVYETNTFSISDGSHCATTLARLVFKEESSGELVHHINKFDNGDLSDPKTKSIAAYTKNHLNDPKFCEETVEKSLEFIIKEGEKYEIEMNEVVKTIISNGLEYSINADGKINVFEVIIEDALLSTNIADEYYKTTGNKTHVVITIFYNIKGGVKLSFRSMENEEGVTALMLANMIGGGGHTHASAYLSQDNTITSFRDLIKDEWTYSC